MQVFIISADLAKLRGKMLAWAGACLFISITKILPSKIELLGLDLTDNESTLGWFIAAICFLYTLHFLLAASLALLRHFLPAIRKNLTKNIQSPLYGINAKERMQQEAQEEYYQNRAGPGSISEDIAELSRLTNSKNECINTVYTCTVNLIRIGFGMVFPFLFSVISIFSIFKLNLTL